MSVRPELPSGPVRSARRALSTALMVLGAVLVLWSVLALSSAGFGSRPTASFAQRRGYDQVKREVHAAFPMALVRALAGLALIAGGNRLRRAADRPPAP